MIKADALSAAWVFKAEALKAEKSLEAGIGAGAMVW